MRPDDDSHPEDAFRSGSLPVVETAIMLIITIALLLLGLIMWYGDELSIVGV